MAKKDFYDYLLNVQSQVLAIKSDLKDFEDGLKVGHVTEDQVKDIKEEYKRIDDNYQRLLYVGYLLELPKSKFLKSIFKKKTKDIDEYMSKMNSSEDCILKENEIAIKLIRKEIKKLTKSKDEKENSK